jgi:[ribosomal protein S5]-alanine N-acetyltransferase
MAGMVDLPPVLSDGVVTLRPHRVDDVAAMVVMGNDDETRRWTPVPVPFTQQMGLDWIDFSRARWSDGSMARWAIEVGGRFAGNIDVRVDGRPTVGYTLAPSARGRGVATRALRTALSWAFEERGLPVMHWACDAGNLASWRVAHSCGFTFHGEVPSYGEHRGTLVDVWLASLKAGEPMSPRTPWWPNPVIDGERVRLRPVRDSDAPRVVEACSDPRTRHFLNQLPDPYTEADALAWIRTSHLLTATGAAVRWAVADPDDDRMLGNVSVFRLNEKLDPTGGEIGYWAHPDARGRGALTEAVGLVATYAFTPVAEGGLGRGRLQIGAAWSNAASRHVAEKAGFTLFAHPRLDGVVGVGDDAHHDRGAWYELLNS